MTLRTDIDVADGPLKMVVDDLRAVGANVDAAIGRAIPRAVRGTRTAVVRATAKDLGVAQKSLYRRGDKSRPIRETFDRDGRQVRSGGVEVEGKRIPLAEFNPKPVWKRTRRKVGKRTVRGRRHAGASYKIGAQGRARADKLFVVEFASGKRRVYARVGRGRKLTGDGVQQRFGPSVPHASGNRPEVQAELSHRAAERFLKEANHQLNFAIARGASRA